MVQRVVVASLVKMALAMLTGHATPAPEQYRYKRWSCAVHCASCKPWGNLEGAASSLNSQLECNEIILEILKLEN